MPTNKPSSIDTRRARAFGFAAITACLLGALVGVAAWVEPPPTVMFYACWASHLRTPLVDDNEAAKQDRSALAAGDYFPHNTFHTDRDLSAGVLNAELQSAGEEGSPARVVYVSAYATRAADGDVVLMTEEFQPLSGAGGLPLKELLGLLSDGATPTLLVLDISPGLANGPHGLLPCGVDEALYAELESAKKLHWLTLVSCAPGETATEIPGQGRTTFGYFFEAGLRGHADGYNDSTITDGRVSARELSAYVVDRVAKWTEQRQGSVQTPQLIATGETDFLLAINRSEPPAASAAADEVTYPEFLLQAWRTRDAWLGSDAGDTLPRLVRRYEIELLEAERRWRVGGDQQALAKRLAVNTKSLLHEFAESQEELDSGAVVSLAQLERRQGPPPEAFLDAWQQLLAAVTQTLPQPATAKASAQAADPYTAFREATKDATHAQLAMAGIAVLRNSPGEFVAALSLVGGELQRQSPEPRFAETSALARLVEIAESNAAVDGALLLSCLETALRRERAWADVAAGAPQIALLQKADRCEQMAWAILLSPGYASANDARDRLREADLLYRQAEEIQSQYRAAVATRDRALATLPLLLPTVRHREMLRDEWRAAAADAALLADALDKPLAHKRAEAAKQLSRIEAIANNIERLLDPLLAPTQAETVTELVAALKQGSIERLADVESLLATPLLSASRRAALCVAAAKATRSLDESLLAFVAEPYKATWRPQLRMEPNANSVRARATEASLAEAQFAAAMLRLGGFDAAPLEAKIANATNKASDRTLVDLLTLLRGTATDAIASLQQEKSIAARARAARVLPAGRYTSSLDARAEGPPLVERRRRRQAWEAFMAERLNGDAEGLTGSHFAAQAAGRLRAASTKSSPSTEISVEPVARPGDTPGETALVLPNINERQRQETIALQIGHAAGASIEVDLLQPTNCLTIEKQIVPAVGGSEIRLTFRLRPDAAFAQLAATSGVLLRVAAGPRQVFRRIDTPGLASVSPVVVLAEVDGARYALAQELRLPPSVSPQAVRLIVQNRVDRPLKLTGLLQATVPYAVSGDLPPLGEATLGLAAIANEPAAAPPSGSNATPQPSLTQLNSLELTLREQPAEREIYHQVSTLGVADPSDFVRILDARIAPDESGQPVARLRAERLPGGPDELTIDWSIESPTSAAPVVAGGKLSGQLSLADPQAGLHARLADPLSGDRRLLAYAALNGVSKALAWRANLPGYERSTTFTPEQTPTIQIEAPELVATGTRLDFSIDAAPAPPGATLRVALCRIESAGATVVEHEKSFTTARRKQVAAAPQLVEGKLLLHPTIAPHVDSFDTGGLIGRRQLLALVSDAAGNEIARATRGVTLDGDPASVVELISPAKPAVAGAPLAVRVHARDDLSGITQVRCYVGEPAEGSPPAGAAVVVATADPQQPDEWLAAAPMPAGAPAATLTVEVTNGVGLVRNKTTTINLISPALAAVGQVTGAVTEGTLPQPGLAVELRDAEQSPVASSQTNAQGEFLFKAVKPGKYLVWSIKAQSQRVGAAAVEVKAGVTSRAELRLSL